MPADVLPFALTRSSFFALVLVLAVLVLFVTALQQIFRAEHWGQYCRGIANRITAFPKSYKNADFVRSDSPSLFTCLRVALRCRSTSNGLEATWDNNASASESNERHAQACGADEAWSVSFQSEGFNHARSSGLHPFTPKSRVSVAGKEHRDNVEMPQIIHIPEGSVAMSEKERASPSIVHAPSATQMEGLVGKSPVIRGTTKQNTQRTVSLLVSPSASQQYSVLKSYKQRPSDLRNRPVSVNASNKFKKQR
jgi:hypothetical protein